MIAGARQGTISALKRLVSFSMSQDLGVYVVPGTEITRAYGLDIEAAGINIVASPRHASVLLIAGDMPAALRDAAAVIYAQMPRPRVLFNLTTSTTDLLPLPTADITAGLSQQELVEGVNQLRKTLAKSAFHSDVSDFDAPVLQIRIEYVCPMHPEVIQDEPGSCPKCGMNLMPREVQANAPHSHTEPNTESNDHSSHDPQHTDHAAVEYTCPMHPEVVQSEPGSCPECGMNLEPREIEAQQDHQHMDHAAVEYTCPMHPEVVQSEPGSCPECGMNLEPREPQSSRHDHAEMESGMNHDDSGFMSMIDVTKNLPRSGDGLPMDWLDVPFGPFFPGLPAGLLLTFTLDGDTVAAAKTTTLVGNKSLLCHPIPASDFIEKLTTLDPLAPNSYRLLACLAIEDAASIKVETSTAKVRLVVLERERIVSHLSWLTLFAEQTGFDWLKQRASSLQQSFMQANIQQVTHLKKAVQDLTKQLQRTPLLKSRSQGIGRLPTETELTVFGPVARAAGINMDARNNNKLYSELGFAAVTATNGDVYARLQLRLDEIKQSIELIQKAAISNSATVSVTNNTDTVSGDGQAVIETPRGQATLQLTLNKGKVTSAQLETPSTQHLTLIEQLTDQQELGDALVTVGSLDLSPWEIRQ